MGTFNAIYNIREQLNKVFFYTNADEISNINIQSMYLRFLESNASVVSLLKKDKDGYLNINEETITEKLLAGNGTHIELGCKFINNIKLLLFKKYSNCIRSKLKLNKS